MNLANLMYLFHYKPFEDYKQNRIEIFNEVIISLLTYIYLFFKNSMVKDDNVGQAYISIYLFCVFVNVGNLTINILIDEIIDTYSSTKKKYLWLRYELWKRSWFN